MYELFVKEQLYDNISHNDNIFISRSKTLSWHNMKQGVKYVYAF